MVANNCCYRCFITLFVLLNMCLLLSAGEYRSQTEVKITGILPEPQQVYWGPQKAKPFRIDSSVVIITANDSPALEQKAVALFKEDLAKAYNVSAASVVRDYKSVDRCVLVSRSDSESHLNHLKALASKLSAPSRNAEESYKLVVTTDGILISAPTAKGILYGVQTLRQLLRADGTIPTIAISDWPDQKIRASYGTMFHVSMEQYIRNLAKLKINMAIMESPWNARGNWWYSPSGQNARKADEFFRLCREYGIEPVPLIQGFGWAYGVVGLNPNCAEGIWVQDESYVLDAQNEVEIKNRNVLKSASAPIVVTDLQKRVTYKEGEDYRIIPGITHPRFEKKNRPWKIARTDDSRIPSGQKVLVSYNYMDYCRLQTPYCPNDPETYRIVDRTLNTVIKRYKPKYIHIGHDEVRYINRCSRCKTSGLTKGDIVIRDINHWYDTIKKADSSVKVMMWSDLVLDKHLDKPVIEAISDEIIICPWMYGGGKKMQESLAKQLHCLLDEHNRPVLGAAAGYTNENIWLWKEACKPYMSNEKMLGFFFSFWGESQDLWSSLSFAAEYSWSSSKPDRTVFDLYNTADLICRKRGLGIGLSPKEQAKVIRRRLKFDAVAGKDSSSQKDELDRELLAIRKEVVPHVHAELADVQYAEGVDSPGIIRGLGQLGKYYAQESERFTKSRDDRVRPVKDLPTYTIRRVNGDSSSWKKDEFWKGIPLTGKFVIRNGENLVLSKWATTAQAAYDEKYVYVRMECPFPDVAKLEYNTRETSRSATPIWENDCVQVFFRPGKLSRTQKAAFYQVIVNVVGKTMTRVHNGKDIPEIIPVECKIEDKSWSCKMAVPLSWFGISAKDVPGDKWGINFARTQRYPNEEYASWSLLPPGTMLWFLQPEHFGNVTFEE